METEWTNERMELVKRTVCPKGISTDEFLLFAEQCQRSGLDPLLKEAFCVPRRANIGSKDKPQWITKHEFQPSEAGMLARAERFPDHEGCTAGAVYESDACEVDQGAGTVSHKFNPAKRTGRLIGAWGRVQRNGKLAVVVWLDMAGYVQDTPLWRKIPATMMEKCARVAALRKAYPSAFGGLYIREEMPAEEFPAVEADQADAPALPAVSASELLRLDLEAQLTKKLEKVGVQKLERVKAEPAKAAVAKTKPAAGPNKARADALWMRCKANGMTAAAFGSWTRSVLQTDSVKPTKDWTEDDCDHLEAALLELETAHPVLEAAAQ